MQCSWFECVTVCISLLHADDKVKQLLVYVEEISHWMNGNRLKINKDKTHTLARHSTSVI